MGGMGPGPGPGPAHETIDSCPAQEGTIARAIFAGPWPRAFQITNFVFLLQHLLRLSSNFYIYSILLQQCLRLLSNFSNFCYSCCSLFG